MARCAIFASGNGSNFIKLQEALSVHPRHEAACLVCDKPTAPVVPKALQAGIPVLPILYRRDAQGNLDRASAEHRITGLLHDLRVDCIALAGFMKILGSELLTRYSGRILNIHPSLLPKHPGAHGMIESINSDDTELGITIHIVDSGVDTGPILTQKSFSRIAGDDRERESTRLHELEHATYPVTLVSFMDSIDK